MRWKKATVSLNSQASNFCKNDILLQKNCLFFSLANTMEVIVVFLFCLQNVCLVRAPHFCFIFLLKKSSKRDIRLLTDGWSDTNMATLEVWSIVCQAKDYLKVHVRIFTQLVRKSNSPSNIWGWLYRLTFCVRRADYHRPFIITIVFNKHISEHYLNFTGFSK